MSSGSRRLHWGHRFMFGVPRFVAAWFCDYRISLDVCRASLDSVKAVTSHRTPNTAAVRCAQLASKLCPKECYIYGPTEGAIQNGLQIDRAASFYPD